MSLSATVLAELAETAIAAARDAAAGIAAVDGTGLARARKVGGTSEASQVVTEADLEAQRRIVAHLEPTCRRYGLGLLTEESPDDGSRHRRPAFWCVDPLDGTLPFAEGRAGYAVSIALVDRGGSARIGVVCDPRSGLVYHAVAGGRLFREGEPWSPLDVARAGEPLTVFASVGTQSAEAWPAAWRELVGLSHNVSKQPPRLVSGPGAVMSAVGALHAAPAIYLSPPRAVPSGISLWDLSATAALYAAAGASATDILGQPLDLNRADSTFASDRGALYATEPRLTGWTRRVWPG